MGFAKRGCGSRTRLQLQLYFSESLRRTPLAIAGNLLDLGLENLLRRNLGILYFSVRQVDSQLACVTEALLEARRPFFTPLIGTRLPVPTFLFAAYQLDQSLFRS